jgi:hypothetical protein
MLLQTKTIRPLKNGRIMRFLYKRTMLYHDKAHKS